MKKIIAISLMFALVAGAVFADTSVGGGVETRFSLAKQTGAEDDDPVMGGSVDANIVLQGSNDDGTLGGLFRLNNSDIVRTDGDNSWNPDGGGRWFHRVFVWWKPIDQVKIFLGIDQDGLFATGDFMEWGFHTGDNDYLFNHHWDFWRQIFPGNWDGFGLAFSFYPMPGLDLNLALPTGRVGWPQATPSAITKTPPITNSDSDSNDGMIPSRLRFVGNYSLDFGKISFAYFGSGIANDKGSSIGAPYWEYGKNSGTFGLSVLVTAIDSIQIKVGGSAILWEEDAEIFGGLGVAYSGDGFGVKLRGAVRMHGDDDMLITGNIMPYFGVGEKGQVLVDIGFTSMGDSSGWYLTPAYRLGINGGAFKIGLQVYNNIQMGGNITCTGDEYIKWNIPMSLSFNF